MKKNRKMKRGGGPGGEGNSFSQKYFSFPNPSPDHSLEEKEKGNASSPPFKRYELLWIIFIFCLFLSFVFIAVYYQ